MLQYRAATHEDFKIIASMPRNEEELLYMYPKGKFPISPEELEEVASRRFSPTVIAVSGDVAGYCNLYDVQPDRECWLGNVIIHPDYRNRGVGSYLLNTMKNLAKTLYNSQQLKLVCHNTNTSALLFYYKNGFVPYDMKVVDDYKGHVISGIIMSADL